MNHHKSKEVEKCRGGPKVGFGLRPKAEAEGWKKFGLRPKAEAEGTIKNLNNFTSFEQTREF